MFNLSIIILLILLVVVDLFLIGIFTYSCKSKNDTATKFGLNFMSIIIICNIIFSVGGYFLW